MSRTLQEQLHRIATALEKIQNQIKSTSDQYEANSKREQTPLKIRAELHVPQAVAAKTDARDNRQETRDRKRVWIEAGALAAAIIIGWIAVNQWFAMRVSERPWVRVWIDVAPVQELNPAISGVVHLLGSGKTPAKTTNGEFFVEKVTNGREPSFPEDKPFAKIAAGTQFPNIPLDSPLNIHSISLPEMDDLKAEKVFFVIYGKVAYTDFFRTQHWTRFCQGWYLLPGDYTAKKCTEYNDIDNN